MINERRLSGEKDERRDLLSNLVSANEELLDDGEQRLEEAELIGTDLKPNLLAHLPKRVLSRKHIHVLPCWIRGEDSLSDTNDCLIVVAF